jgi:hypothetical protein
MDTKRLRVIASEHHADRGHLDCWKRATTGDRHEINHLSNTQRSRSFAKFSRSAGCHSPKRNSVTIATKICHCEFLQRAQHQAAWAERSR